VAIKQSETPVTHWPTAAATSQHLRFEWVSVTDFRALCLISRQVAVLWLSSVSSFLEWKTASSNISRCRRLIKSFTLRSSSAVFIKYRCYRQMPSELRRCLGKWGGRAEQNMMTYHLSQATKSQEQWAFISSKTRDL